MNGTQERNCVHAWTGSAVPAARERRVSEAVNAAAAPDDVALLALSLTGETPTAYDD